jgi:hypothetical protein
MVSAEKNVSTAFSHEPEVGVKWKIHRGWRASNCRALGCFEVAARDLALDGVNETDELLMTMALRAAADDRAIEHVERGGQRRRTMAFVVASWCRTCLA